ncbi:MAG TPA: hypothetical protein VFN05_02970 [Actinomycetes bacterium]|nr:hypothetical protein [Actinomycetes bacterium]
MGGTAARPSPRAVLAAETGAVWALDGSGRQLLRVEAASGRVTAVTPLDNLEPAWMALAVGAGSVWVGGARAQRAGPARGMVVDRIDPRSGRLVGAFTLARNTKGFLAAGHGSLRLASFGGGELLRLDPP